MSRRDTSYIRELVRDITKDLSPEVINEVDEVLQDHWVKGIMSTTDGCYCLLGALHHVAGVDTHKVDLDRAIMIASWNDHPDTTKADVINLLRSL